MKKLFFFLIPLFLGVISFPISIRAQINNAEAPTLNQHIGLNVSFNVTNTWDNAIEVSDYFREFHAWRNATQGANILHEYTNLYPDTWPTNLTLNQPLLLYGEKYLYDFSNYESLYDRMQQENKVIFPAIAEIHQYLATDAFHNNSDPNNVTEKELWDSRPRKRKAVPHVKVDNNGQLQLQLAQGESYTSPNSYRFFGEYLSYYSILFGNNNMNFDHSNLYMNSDPSNINGSLGRGQVNYLELWNEPDSWWAWNSTEGYYTPEELATCMSAIYDGHGGRRVFL